MTDPDEVEFFRLPDATDELYWGEVHCGQLHQPLADPSDPTAGRFRLLPLLAVTPNKSAF